MRILVTKEDLERGVRGSAWENPLGYAFARAFNAKYAFVGRTICLNTGLRIDLQDIGLEKMTAFDKGEKLVPFDIPVSAEAVYRSSLNHKF